MNDTFPKLLQHNFETYGDTRRAMRYKYHGIWLSLSWKDYYQNAKYLALGLRHLGFADGDRLLIVGNNKPEWYFAELAAQANHGAAVAVQPDLTPAEIKFIAENSGARFAIVQDQEQVDKLAQVQAGLPLRQVIYWNYKGLARYNDPLLMGYRQVLQLGEQSDKEQPGLYTQNVASGKAHDICAIVYAVGNPGDAPTCIIHSYESIRTQAENLLRVDPWHHHDNLAPLVPPISTVEQCFSIACHLLSTCTLNFAEEPSSHFRDVREIRPSIVIRGARYWENQAATVQARVLGSDAVKRFAFRTLMPIGYQIADLKERKQKPGVLKNLAYGLADAILFGPIKASLGLSNARICYASGAALGADAARFFSALNVPLKNIQGAAS